MASFVDFCSRLMSFTQLFRRARDRLWGTVDWTIRPPVTLQWATVESVGLRRRRLRSGAMPTRVGIDSKNPCHLGSDHTLTPRGRAHSKAARSSKNNRAVEGVVDAPRRWNALRLQTVLGVRSSGAWRARSAAALLALL